ncbi:MAG: rhodanese-like domain-containing protein [Anaerococcus sp.]|nr:rhodanese-like domain-containing protein [Anaerococcus sp.]
MIEKTIPGKEVEKNKDAFQLIDVRTKAEYDSGHIEGAINIPFEQILDNLDKIDKTKPALLYCRSNNRSQIAKLALKSVGYDFVYIGDGVIYYDYKLVK